ncbi:hypothetical protein ACRDNQ_09125 [Palleronia sp. KMU-117]|uniref:hypothetical protein n=1 Tax=Palleronia sp. KMU-117 TaxID=3434108 RepID=UPI003D737733
MTLIGPILFALGLCVCWVLGRHVTKGDSLLVPLACALFGIAGLITGFPDLWTDSFVWALLVLAAYGAVGSIVFRAGRAARGKS